MVPCCCNVSLCGRNSFLCIYSTGNICEVCRIFFAGSIAYLGRKFIVLDFRVFAVSTITLGIFIFLHQGLNFAICIFGTYVTIYLAYWKYFPMSNITRQGDFSYGIYLYAWPVQQLLVSIAPTPFFNFLASLPIIKLLSICSWRFVEKPSLSKKKHIASYINSKLGKAPKLPIQMATDNTLKNPH